MRITTTNNSELVIQARNKNDFQAALLVASGMSDSIECAIASTCEYEFWVHVTANWGNYQASELKDAYAVSKEAIKSRI